MSHRPVATTALASWERRADKRQSAPLPRRLSDWPTRICNVHQSERSGKRQHDSTLQTSGCPAAKALVPASRSHRSGCHPRENLANDRDPDLPDRFADLTEPALADRILLLLRPFFQNG
jgi:hypothetical protein